ncbi:response regulator [Planctomycetota bacterium]
MSKRISVLVIEDEKNIRGILKYNLESDGFEVILAEDGPIGLELAREKEPDVILLDWMMPEMDGLEVLSKLKMNVQTRNIPVFMLTAKKRPCHLRAAIAESVDGYIAKPFDPAKLGEKIRDMLEKLVKS